MKQDYADRIRWFHEARFGLFIHYGLYAIGGRGEWTMFSERIPPATYAQWAQQFTPRADAAEQWVQLAVAAGMKYAVLTTRHHDGFCLFDSAHADFTLSRIQPGRDLVREFVDACRRHGIRPGLYYSLLDWRFPGYFDPDGHPDSALALREQAHAQVRELMTNYGDISVLWYDGEWIDHGRTKRDTVAFWDSAALNDMVYELQPHILVNNRSGIPLDLDTPEQHVKESEAGRGWEACMTIGDACGWGWLRHNPNRKPVAALVQHLATAAAGEGNFLLNIGPCADGSPDPADVERLRAIGDWLAVHGEAIRSSARCDLYDARDPGASIGRWTRKGNTAYLIVFHWPGPVCRIPLVAGTPRQVTLLTTGDEVAFTHEPDHTLVLTGLPDTSPDPYAAVLRVTFDDIPARQAEPDHAAWLKG